MVKPLRGIVVKHRPISRKHTKKKLEMDRKYYRMYLTTGYTLLIVGSLLSIFFWRAIAVTDDDELSSYKDGDELRVYAKVSKTDNISNQELKFDKMVNISFFFTFDDLDKDSQDVLEDLNEGDKCYLNVHISNGSYNIIQIHLAKWINYPIYTMVAIGIVLICFSWFFELTPLKRKFFKDHAHRIEKQEEDEIDYNTDF